MLDSHDLRTVHCLIGGTVQGVGYRQATATQAERLGLKGWVRNLGDGRVEVVATGDPAQIDRLVDWLASGPPAAVVTSVDVAVTTTTSFDSFDIRYSEAEPD